jgi:hypothetical protein
MATATPSNASNMMAVPSGVIEENDVKTHQGHEGETEPAIDHVCHLPAPSWFASDNATDRCCGSIRKAAAAHKGGVKMDSRQGLISCDRAVHAL